MHADVGQQVGPDKQIRDILEMKKMRNNYTDEEMKAILMKPKLKNKPQKYNKKYYGRQNRSNRYNYGLDKEILNENNVSEVGTYEDIVGAKKQTEFKYFQEESGLCNILHIIINEIADFSDIDAE